MKKTALFLLIPIFSVCSQEIDKSLLDKYEIEFISRNSLKTNSFYLEKCDFCDEFKIELFKAGINVSETKSENQNIIEIEFNSLSKGLKVIRGWNGKIISNNGKILSVFNVEKKKVVINPRQDYIDRKNCMLYIANKILETLNWKFIINVYCEFSPMKNTSLISFFLLSITCFSQFDNRIFNGLIETSDSVIFPYEIKISRLGNIVEGYSISDKGGQYETKTNYIITRKNGKLFFKEDEIVYTKADYSAFDDFCLVKFELAEKKFFNSKKLILDFEGTFNDGQPCISGKLNLVSDEFIKKSFSKTAKKISESKILEKKFGDTIDNVLNKIKEVQTIFSSNQDIDLLNNDYLKFNIYQSYRIYIKDFGLIDQDKIKFKVNNNKERELIIEDEAVFFKIDRDKRKNIIKIKGLDAGDVSPITAQIVIESTNKKILHKINLKLLPNETSIIELNF